MGSGRPRCRPLVRRAARCVRDDRAAATRRAPTPADTAVLSGYVEPVRRGGTADPGAEPARELPELLRPALAPDPARALGGEPRGRVRLAAIRGRIEAPVRGRLAGVEH